MAWYVTQSLVVILATFVLGLIVGWLWWGRVRRRVPLGESAAVREVARRFEATVAEREAQIARLCLTAEAPRSPAGSEDATTAMTGTTETGTTGTGTTEGTEGRGTGGTEGTRDRPPEPDGAPATASPSKAADASLGPNAGQARAGSTETPTATRSTGQDRGGQGVTGQDHGEQGVTGQDHGEQGVAGQDRGEQGGPDVEEPHAVAPETATENAVAAETVEQPDDLLRIEGIGPRIATALDGAGIRTYAAIADADTEQLTAALRAAGLTFAPSLVTWPRQAQLLAAGEEEAFAALKDELTAGRARLSARPTDTEPAGVEDKNAEPTGTEPTDTEPDTEPTSVEDEDAADDDAEDELERVEGIGPRIATALHKAGIHTYRQLAAADAPSLQAALAASGLRFAPSLPTWSRQAALLADGDEDGFLALTRTLVSDRDNGRTA